MVEFIVYFISMLVFFGIGAYCFVAAWLFVTGGIAFDSRVAILAGILSFTAGSVSLWLGAILSPFKVFVV